MRAVVELNWRLSFLEPQTHVRVNEAHLSNDRLLRGRLFGGLGLLSRRGGELDRRLPGGRGRQATGAQNLMNLLGVVSSILLRHGSEVIGLLLSGISDLGSLGADDVGSTPELLVDKLLVFGVDQRGEEGNGGRNDGKDPVGQHLDEEAGKEGNGEGLECEVMFSSRSSQVGNARETHSRRGVDILDKDNALSFNQEEVDESVGLTA